MVDQVAHWSIGKCVEAMWISKTKVPDVHGYIGFWMLLEALITDGWCVMVCANGFLSGRVGDSLSTSSAYISISQTLHGTAIYADQLGWLSMDRHIWQSHGPCLGINILIYNPS